MEATTSETSSPVWVPVSAAEAEDPTNWTTPAGYAERVELNVITDLLSEDRVSGRPPFRLSVASITGHWPTVSSAGCGSRGHS